MERDDAALLPQGYRELVTIAVDTPSGLRRFEAHHFSTNFGVLEIYSMIRGRDGHGRTLIAALAPGEWRHANIEAEPVPEPQDGH